MPRIEQTCVPDPICGAPPTNGAELFERFTEPCQTSLEFHGRIRLPLLEQTNELGHRFSVRHHEVQRMLHRFVGSTDLAVDHMEVVVGLGLLIKKL